MSRPRRAVEIVTMTVTVVTADTRLDVQKRIVGEVRRHLELAFGNAVTVEETEC